MSDSVGSRSPGTRPSPSKCRPRATTGHFSLTRTCRRHAPERQEPGLSGVADRGSSRPSFLRSCFEFAASPRREWGAEGVRWVQMTPEAVQSNTTSFFGGAANERALNGRIGIHPHKKHLRGPVSGMDVDSDPARGSYRRRLPRTTAQERRQAHQSSS